MSSSANALKAVRLLNELTSVAVELNLSMQDLVDRQNQAVAEGRKFGDQDLEALRLEADKNLTDLENS